MELDPEKRRIIENLNYRIGVSEEGPEKDNAKRLLDRLLKKYGITLDELNERKLREFTIEPRHKQLAIQLAICLFPVHLHENDIYQFRMYTVRYRRKWHKNDKYSVEINLTPDEYKSYQEKLDATCKFYDLLRDKFEEVLLEELNKKRDAFEVSFFEKSNLIKPVVSQKDNDEHSSKGPSYGLKDAMKAAEFLDDYVFPDHMIRQESKLIENRA